MLEVLLFKLSTCGPCKLMSKLLTELGITHKEMVIDESDEADRLADQYGIKSVPTTILRGEGGVELGRFVGTKTKEQLEEELNKYKNDRD